MQWELAGIKISEPSSPESVRPRRHTLIDVSAGRHCGRRLPSPRARNGDMENLVGDAALHFRESTERDDYRTTQFVRETVSCF